MIPTAEDIEKLPPMQGLILEVLVARRRLGETWWPFDAKITPQLHTLANKGMIEVRDGVFEHTRVAKITDATFAMCTESDYKPPDPKPRFWPPVIDEFSRTTGWPVDDCDGCLAFIGMIITDVLFTRIREHMDAFHPVVTALVRRA